MNILVTGGAGYIGSHTCLLLLQAGHRVIVVDNLANASEQSLARVEQLAAQSLVFENADVRDAQALGRIFKQHTIDAVIHFAGLKAVGESTTIPLHYYDVNVNGSRVLLEAMAQASVHTLIFSSSATVYGDPQTVPITEAAPLSPTNPYGHSKRFVEQMCRDAVSADSTLTVGLLRYFNPVGAHESGQLGEDPLGTPNNLMPYISQVAIGRRPYLSVHGADYDTPDGTGVRDYIHVMDLAQGHLDAIQVLHGAPGCYTYNLGTGQGISVLEMARAFSEACGKEIPYQVVDRRPGDIGRCYADPSLAQRELNWRARRGIDAMTADTWRWQSNNPKGYE